MQSSRNALIIIYLNFICSTGFGQNERIADSLKSYYPSDDKSNFNLQLLYNVVINETNPDSILKYSEILIERSETESNFKLTHDGYMQKGNALRLKGNLDQALNSFFVSIEYAKKINYTDGVGKLYISIADVYSESENHANASFYYAKGIQLLRNSEDSLSLAKALINAGDEYFNIGNLDSALIFTQESEKIFQNINSQIGQAYCFGNIGMVYAELGNDLHAEEYMNKAIQLLQNLGEYYPITVYLLHIADIYLKQGNNLIARNYALKSLKLAEQYGLKEQISDANLKLSEIYEFIGIPKKALQHYKDHIAYRDSVKNIETVQEMADLRTDYEVSQKQIEVDLLNQERKNQRIVNIAAAITSVLIFLLALGLYRRYKYIQETNRIIEIEKSRSENLLLNILPQETAQELKESGRVEAKKFESATVLFSDFKEFTKLASSVEPEQLVKSIDYYFKAFDEIIAKYGLEKIKTIGDAYMCAGGIPKESFTHPKNVIKAAKEMIDFVQRKLPIQDDLVHFEIRIGVHTGPVVAGIVGLKKWQYDIWGDTVNIASRMESMSEPGKVNLSETTYEGINDEFPCKYRGKIDVKNRGPLKMYFLS